MFHCNFSIHIYENYEYIIYLRNYWPFISYLAIVICTKLNFISKYIEIFMNFKIL